MLWNNNYSIYIHQLYIRKIVAFKQGNLAFVQIKDPRLIVAAGADGLGGYGLVDVLLLEGGEGLQALALAGILKQGGLLQPQTVDRLLQIPVLLADAAQVEIVHPHALDAELGAVNNPLRRRDHHIRPQADEAHARAVRGVE